MSGEQRPKIPDDFRVPGLIYRLRRRGWPLSWSPRSDLIALGCKDKTIRLWSSDRTPPQQSEPTRGEWEVISAWCARYHAKQLLWACGGAESDPKSLFDGTIGSLCEIYRKHKISPFNKRARYQTRTRYASSLRGIKATISKVRVKQITFDDITECKTSGPTMGKAASR
jgi:WD40 repeat protein